MPKKIASRTAQLPVVKLQPCRALDIDWADPDTWVGIVAAVGGLGAGVGILVFSEQRIDEDEKNLEDLRKLNRETFKETGQYLSKVCCYDSQHCWCICIRLCANPADHRALQEEIDAIRTPKWTDRREFVDDD